MLLPSCTPQQALARAEEIRRHVRDLALPHAGSSRHGIVTISIGVSAAGTGQGCSFETILKQADEALYRAKASGRDRCELFAQQDPQALGRAFAG